MQPDLKAILKKAPSDRSETEVNAINEAAFQIHKKYKDDPDGQPTKAEKEILNQSFGHRQRFSADDFVVVSPDGTEKSFREAVTELEED